MKNRIIFCLITIFSCFVCSAGKTADKILGTQRSEAQTSIMTQESFVSDNMTLNYWLYTPADAEADMPLLIYLHGGSGKGSDLNIVLENGFPKYLHDGDLGNINAYVIIPQLSKDITGWANISTTLRELITTVASQYHCDNTRISITGHSMGGTGTWSVAAKFPKLFYRIAPLSGSITNTEVNITSLKESAIWAFVGSADVIVNPQSTIDFINTLKSNTASYTIIKDATHFDVPAVYLSEDYKLVDWLLGKGENSSVNTVSYDVSKNDGEYYDLTGRRVYNPTRGFYIQNGKVVVIK